MTSDRLYQALSAFHPLSDEFKIAIEKELTYRSLPRNFLLLEGREICKYAYFLVQGAAVSFTFHNGKKHIEWYWKEGHLVISPKSFFWRMPAREYIQVLKPSDVLYLSYPSALRLLQSFREADIIYRAVMNQYYDLARKRIREYQQLTGLERYRKLLLTTHEIEELFSQSEIASYLGITPQSFSRLKSAFKTK